MLILASMLISGCASHETITLMPTPVIYHDSGIDPFAHLNPEQKNTVTQVFYATNRKRIKAENSLHYGNEFDVDIHLGQANVRMVWNSVCDLTSTKASLSEQREQTEPVILTLDKVVEFADLPGNVLTTTLTPRLTPQQQNYINSINAELARAVDKEIMLYVHGTKVDFANAAILTAEVDHFSGRDFVGVAFSWPSHQNIWHYLSGTDTERALNSSAALQQLLIFLSQYTIAERINILAYSAGAKVASKALFELRQHFAALNVNELNDKFKLGTVVFAAADVGVGVFLERLPAISELSQQVVITITDFDNALIAARLFMGGEVRAGTSDAEPIEESFIIKKNLSNVEIIDISMGHEVRKFDIVGHHYWYRHPWISSDIMFLLRTDLPAYRRGLTPAQMGGIWYLSIDYPEKVKQAAEIELQGQW